ncbi:Maf family protein [Sulfuriflexus mobilis]|uniref:Maf family protein n=1 Tax=Sulfuriflexus mobilis TaxID=1811807 RepID=UPI000F84E324|nr:Maf family protein [Sulfuriflexus mobilis]
MAIYLASQSPRRRELLGQIGVPFDVISVDVPEQRRPAEVAAQFVERLALAKARAGWQHSAQDRPVLGADTIVVLDDEVLGKPADRADAEAMLARLSGREHRVMTAVALVGDLAGEGHEAMRLSISRVRFRVITAAERQAYCATGEPDDKAGAYAIQGRAAVFVEHLEGSYSGVMGLPVFETADLLMEFAVPVI